jgi:hypothetical protein
MLVLILVSSSKELTGNLRHEMTVGTDREVTMTVSLQLETFDCENCLTEEVRDEKDASSLASGDANPD